MAIITCMLPNLSPSLNLPSLNLHLYMYTKYSVYNNYVPS